LAKANEAMLMAARTKNAPPTADEVRQLATPGRGADDFSDLGLESLLRPRARH